jgi:hypothetical protein
MTTSLSAMQTNFLFDIAEDPVFHPPLEKQLREGFLFADVVECLNGTFSTGSFSNDDDQQFPALYFTLDEALKEQMDTRESFEANHDRDDIYEGVVFAVKWHPDDTLEFYSIDDGGVIDASSPVGISTCNEAMGL